MTSYLDEQPIKGSIGNTKLPHRQFTPSLSLSLSLACEMAFEKSKKMAGSSAMNGGDGPHSYAQNSCYQREVVDAAKGMIMGAIAEKLDIENPHLDCPNGIRIADFGSSIGPNTFLAVQNIIEAVELKYQSMQPNHQTTSEFQVFFNDHTTNDFNTLFLSLPPSRNYFAAASPGSFHGRLFPKATLHIAYSSYALHWLSKIPEEVVDKESPAWSGERVHYTGNEMVLRAYSDQFRRDMDAFLSARAHEIVGGGLMLLIIPSCPDVVLPSQTANSLQFGLFGSCLMDMAKLGIVSEEKLESFNIPLYLTSPKELEEVVERNGHFTVETMENFRPHDHHESPDVQKLSVHLRAAIEGVITEHFGSEIVEDLFERFAKKLEENYFIFDKEFRKEFVSFACLKRKINHDHDKKII